MTFTSQHPSSQSAACHRLAPSLASSWWPTLFSRYGRTRYIMQNSRILARWSLGKYLHFAYLFHNLDFGSTKVQMNNLPREWSDVMHSLGGTALRESTEHCGLTRGLLRANYSISQKKLSPSLQSLSLFSLSPSRSLPRECRLPNRERTRPGGLGFVFVSHHRVSLSHSAIIPFTALAYLPLVRCSPRRPACCLFEQSDSALLRLLEKALPLLY